MFDVRKLNIHIALRMDSFIVELHFLLSFVNVRVKNSWIVCFYTESQNWFQSNSGTLTHYFEYFEVSSLSTNYSSLAKSTSTILGRVEQTDVCAEQTKNHQSLPSGSLVFF